VIFILVKTDTKTKPTERRGRREPERISELTNSGQLKEEEM
jgi:hypothetical protein